MIHYTLAERETTIVWDDEERVAKVYTASPISMRKLDKLCAECPDTYKRTWVEQDGDKVTAARYEVASCYIRFAKPASEARKANGRRVAEMMAERRRTDK